MKLLLCTAALAAAFTMRTAAVTAPPGEHTWTIDPVHSSVMFKVKHAQVTWFYGMFKTISGTFTIDPDHPADGKVEVKIDAASVDTRNEDRDKHVRGSDFLDAKQYPDITFTSKKVQRDGDNWTIDGDLTMRGKTKPVTLRAQKTGEGEFSGKIIGVEATMTIKRSDFGMSSAQTDKALSDEIALTLSIEGKQAQAPAKDKGK